MIIGIDGNEANVVEGVGVSVYTQKLLEYFAKIAGVETKFVVYLKSPPLPFLPKANEFFSYKVVTPTLAWSQIMLPLSLFLGPRPDVFFSPAHYSPRVSPVPTVVTIHDLAYFLFPDEFLKKDLYQLKNWTAYSVKKAKKIICVSKTTKKDLLKFYPVDDSKASVVYNGFEKKVKKPIPPNSHPLTPNKYILYVGTLQPRKNITTLIKAFSYFKKDKPEMKLVIAGKKGWLYDQIFDLVASFGLEKEIIFTGHVRDEELVWLYKNAACFVLPSLYEGFGMPLLEAMVAETPVIASRTPALMEIGSDAALYFDAGSDHDLLKELETVIHNKKLKDELVIKGRARVKQFSWEDCAQETLEVIRSAAK